MRSNGVVNDSLDRQSQCWPTGHSRDDIHGFAVAGNHRMARHPPRNDAQSVLIQSNVGVGALRRFNAQGDRATAGATHRRTPLHHAGTQRNEHPRFPGRCQCFAGLSSLGLHGCSLQRGGGSNGTGNGGSARRCGTLLDLSLEPRRRTHFVGRNVHSRYG